MTVLMSTEGVLTIDIIVLQEAQVTIECIIPQKHHRTIMGAKGSRVQLVTSQYEVGIKFPDRNPNADQAEGKH